MENRLYEFGNGLPFINTVSSSTLKGFLGVNVLPFSLRKTVAKLGIPRDCQTPGDLIQVGVGISGRRRQALIFFRGV